MLLKALGKDVPNTRNATSVWHEHDDDGRDPIKPTEYGEWLEIEK